MDTVASSSRKSNTGFLSIAGIIMGAFALIVAIGALIIAIVATTALVKLGSVSKDINDLKGAINELKDPSAQIDSLNSQVSQLAQLAQQTTNYNRTLASQTQAAFNSVSEEVIGIKARLDKVEAACVDPVRSATGVVRSSVVAGPEEYVVKAGDTTVKIARDNGVSLADLVALNPDVNWQRLRVGQKLKLPAKAGDQSAQQAQPAQ